MVTYTINDVEQYVEENRELLEFYRDHLNPHAEKQKFNYFNELLVYYSFVAPAKLLVNEFSTIFEQENDLDCEPVRRWVVENTRFFKTNLFMFGVSYLDKNGLLEQNFYNSSYDFYVDFSEFIPIIQYWQLMWNLHFGQYHLVKQERKFTEPNPKDYYYVEPDPNAPSDIEVVKTILRMG